MAYTSSLRLELPVTGTLSGTWGDRVNEGITKLLDASVAGTAAVTHDDSANYTLTSNNAASDEARQMFLNIGGTLTAARNVVCPSVSKLYFVKNATSGGFAVTLKTSAGTGITVPNGDIAVLYCDGTNVVNAISNFTALNIASANIDGGTIDGTVIGGTTPAAVTTSSLTATTANIDGGTIDGTTIGGSSAAAATVTVLTATSDSTFSSTGAVKISSGTTAERPTPASGQIRFNSDDAKFEGYDGSAWGQLGGGATGGGGDAVFVENDQTVTTNYTIPASKNAMSTGPVTINSGVTVTVSSGSRYVVI
jgi:hypothetical protein